ncbi:MAG: hypothetical protein ABI837_03820, partial [Acidobacteriota bacterium]
MRHSTLPWYAMPFAAQWTLPVLPLTSITTGRRDRLSLLAQFAAHAAFLQFAGIVDGDVDPDEWAVLQKRGCDCRLIRVASRTCLPDAAPPPLTAAQQFAELVEAPPLDVLKRSWARADAVYAEATEWLARDSAADLRWAMQAAEGEVAAPGDEALRTIWRGRNGRFSGASSFPSLEALAAIDDTVTVLRLGSGSLPSRFGAIEALRPLVGDSLETRSETEIAERVAEFLSRSRCIFLVAPRSCFDPPSWKVVELLSSFDDGTWVFAEGEIPLPGSRSFVLAPAVARGSGRLATLTEPLRSYIGALALLGTTIPCELATRFLARFFYEQSLDALVIEGVTSIRDDAFEFLSDAHRDEALQTIPSASRP